MNTTTTDSQRVPAISADVGSFVVVWEGVDGDNAGVFGQRFSHSGARLGAEFRVNAATAGRQTYPQVASVSQTQTGAFIVIWFDGLGGFVTGRRFDTAGQPAGAEFRVNTVSEATSRPRIAADAFGDFVVVWEGSGGTSGKNIYGRRFDSSGAPLAAAFRVNTYTTNDQTDPAVAADVFGDFVVVWVSVGQPANTHVYMQRFNGFVGFGGDSYGVPLGAEQRVDTTVSGLLLRDPDVARSSGGPFVVVWDSATLIEGRRYDATGTPVGAPALFATRFTDTQSDPRVAMDDSGAFSVAWRSYLTGVEDVMVRRFAANGAGLAAEFRVNTTTSGSQQYPAVGTDPAGNFAVVWQSDLQDGSSQGVYAQRFCAALAGDADGSGTITVSDVLYLINNLFAGGPAPVHSADANGDGQKNVSDVLYLINHLFAGGPAPACAP